MMRVCVADLEADGLLQQATVIHCGVFKDINTGEIQKFKPTDIQAMLDYMDTIDVLIMHNGIGYDWPLLKKLHDYTYKGKKVDTLVMSRLLNPDRRPPFYCPNKGASPHGVEAWGYRVGRGKPEHNDWTQFSPEMLHRCTEDVEIQHLIYKALLKEAKGQDWRDAFLLSFNLFSILQQQEDYGWKVDRPYMDKSINLLTHWMERIDRIVIPYLPKILVVDEQKVKGQYNYVKKPFLKSGGYSASSVAWLADCGYDESSRVIAGCYSRIHYRTTDLNSNMEVKDYLLKAGWIPDKWNYKKDENGRPAKDSSGQLIKASPKLSHGDSFIGVKGGVGRLIARRVQCRHRRSNIEGWVKAIREDGAIASRVSGVATTARMKHAGIVNVPNNEAFFGRQMRRCFIARKGMVLVGCDSAGCQNRMLAARVGDDSFTDTLLNGNKADKTSIHHVNQKAIKDVAGLDVTYGQAKGLNYAFMFGASDKKLGDMIGVSKEVGTRLRASLLSVAAGFEDLVKRLTDEWRSNAKKRANAWGKVEYYNGWITGLDGRPIRIASEHQILVYVLQSDEAIFMSAAVCMMYKRLTKKYVWGVDFGFVCFMHDELNLECKPEIAEEVASIMERSITDAGLFYNIACKHEGEAVIGKNWEEIH